MKFRIENLLTDQVLGVYDAKTAQQAIDAAYQDRGWKDFADARAQGATAAQEGEIAARHVDDEGLPVGRYIGYSPCWDDMSDDHLEAALKAAQKTWSEALKDWDAVRHEKHPGCREWVANESAFQQVDAISAEIQRRATQ